MLREPVHDIPVIGGNALRMALAVADDIFLGQAVLLAEVNAKLHRLIIDLVEIGGVRQAILANFKRDVGIITGALGTGAAMPAPVIPRKRLVSGNRPIRQLADKSVNADLPIHGLVPVIVVLVLSQQAIIRADIAFQPRVVGPGAMHHNALGGNLAACLVAGVVRENQCMQIHSETSCFFFKANDAAGAVFMHQSSAAVIKGQYLVVRDTLFCGPHTAHLGKPHAMAGIGGFFCAGRRVPRIRLVHIVGIVPAPNLSAAFAGAAV